MKLTKNILVVSLEMEGGREFNARFDNISYVVDIVNSGIDGMRLIQKGCIYDYLITDCLLDEISGLALCAFAKKRYGILTIGINNGNSIVHKVAKEIGVDCVLEPPVCLNSLLDMFVVENKWEVPEGLYLKNIPTAPLEIFGII